MGYKKGNLWPFFLFPRGGIKKTLSVFFWQFFIRVIHGGFPVLAEEKRKLVLPQVISRCEIVEGTLAVR